jgi:glycosyltransferase involved in cell wall biosynthesis
MRLAEELGVADRVEWLGVISDAELYRQYAHARAVLFPPLDEDYGYVTLEAMLSSKAVITCTDSGGALELVVPGETAVVVPPTPDALAAAMDNLWGAPARAREMGAAARAHYEDLDLSWTSVVDRLLA